MVTVTTVSARLWIFRIYVSQSLKWEEGLPKGRLSSEYSLDRLNLYRDCYEHEN